SLLARLIRVFGKMGTQCAPDFVDRLDQCIREFFVPEMLLHLADQSLPQFFAALLMNRFIADDRELVRSRCNENENVTVLRVVVQSEAVKSFLGGAQGIAIQLSALNKYPDPAGGRRFGFANRLHDSVVPKLAEEFFGSH